MAVFKRGKVYRYSFMFNGKHIQESTKQGNLQVARQIEAARKTELAKGLVGIKDQPKREPLHVRELLDRLQEDYAMRDKAGTANLSLLGIVRRAFGAYLAENLTDEDVKRYITEQRKRGRADATIDNHLRILSQAFTRAKLTPPAIPKLTAPHANVRCGFFNREELDRLSVNLPHDLRDFCLFGYLTGWRKNAIATLEWSDVRDGNIYLRSVHSKNGRPYFVPLVGELAELIARREASRVISRDGGVVLSSFVFHRNGAPVMEFRKSWDSACIAANLGTMLCPRCKDESKGKYCSKCRRRRKYQGRIFHDLRRSAARNLIRSGVQRSVAMKITGHKTEAMFNRYDIVDESDLRAAMEKIALREKVEQQKVVAISK